MTELDPKVLEAARDIWVAGSLPWQFVEHSIQAYMDALPADKPEMVTAGLITAQTSPKDGRTVMFEAFQAMLQVAVEDT